MKKPELEKTEFLGVYRGAKFSPNHIVNDLAIFKLVGASLEAAGHEVKYCSEMDLLEKKAEVTQSHIFTMAREKQVVAALQDLEKDGKTVLNSGRGIENCFRINMTNLLLENGVPYPKSSVIPTRGYDPISGFRNLNGDGLWIKRGDFHAIHKEDVAYVRNVSEAMEMLEEFALRDIEEVVVSEHLNGDLVKFYGVLGTGFFYWFYPYDHNHVKYPELPRFNSDQPHRPFSIRGLRETAEKAAEVLEVDVYGGDAIVTADGSFHVIDLNDWPSFAPCRTEAAPFIAERIMAKSVVNI